jgi:hypothetical protein
MLLRPLPFVLVAVVFLLSSAQRGDAWPQSVTQHELAAELAAPARAADAWKDVKKSFLRSLLSFGESKKAECYEKDRGVIAQHIAVDIVSSALERECLLSFFLDDPLKGVPLVFMSALALCSRYEPASYQCPFLEWFSVEGEGDGWGLKTGRQGREDMGKERGVGRNERERERKRERERACVCV